MYIDKCLIDDFHNEFGCCTDDKFKYCLENCGIWYTLEEIREEIEDEKTLEELCTTYYYILDGNSFKFCNADEFIEDCDEYML